MSIGIVKATRQPLYCSFCGKEGADVGYLVAGPQVFICNECVELCQEIGQTMLSENIKSNTESKSGDEFRAKLERDRTSKSDDAKMQVRHDAIFKLGAEALDPTVPKFNGHELGSTERCTFYDGYASTHEGFQNPYRRSNQQTVPKEG